VGANARLSQKLWRDSGTSRHGSKISGGNAIVASLVGVPAMDVRVRGCCRPRSRSACR
jgi:hypothetical protein